MIKFKHNKYNGIPDSYSLRIWRFLGEYHHSNINYHGPNREAITKGWRLINLKRANGNHGTGHAFRLIRYWKDGSWSYIDFCWNRKNGK